MSNTATRIFAAFVMIVAILWGQWWLAWSFAVIFLFIFPDYYEILFYGIAYDALYGISIPEFWNFPYVFSVISIVLFLLSLVVRKSLSAYEPTL